MSFRAIVWAFDQIRAGRSPSASCSLVLLKLADRSNDDGCCWPGQERIGADISLSDETVRQCCRRLEGVPLLEIQRRKDSAGRDLSNVYRLVGFVGGEAPNFTTPSPKLGGRPLPIGDETIKVNLSLSAAARAPSDAAAFRKKRITRPSGIVTWDADDIQTAAQIELSHDASAIAAAVTALKAVGRQAVPGLIEAELERQAAEHVAIERRAAAEAAREARLKAPQSIDPATRERGEQMLAALRRKRAQQEATS